MDTGVCGRRVVAGAGAGLQCQLSGGEAAPESTPHHDLLHPAMNCLAAPRVPSPTCQCRCTCRPAAEAREAAGDTGAGARHAHSAVLSFVRSIQQTVFGVDKNRNSTYYSYTNKGERERWTVESAKYIGCNFYQEVTPYFHFQNFFEKKRAKCTLASLLTKEQSEYNRTSKKLHL